MMPSTAASTRSIGAFFFFERFFSVEKSSSAPLPAAASSSSSAACCFFFRWLHFIAFPDGVVGLCCVQFID